MKIYVLVDNTASSNFKAEHGLSYLIDGDTQVLLDTGHSDLFIENSKKLKLNLNKVNTIVLSHGHWDHGNGLKFLNEKKLICHPNAFQKRFRKGGHENIGLELSFRELRRKYEIVYTRSSYKISENIYFLGEIPRINSFESKTTPFVLENEKDDFVLDDSALAVILHNELIVISGCAHSGICNIVEHAKQITGIKKVKAVLGGFHLKHQNNQTTETINYFKSHGISEIYPSHCTALPALAAFYQAFGKDQIKAGTMLEF